MAEIFMDHPLGGPFASDLSISYSNKEGCIDYINSVFGDVSNQTNYARGKIFIMEALESRFGKQHLKCVLRIFYEEIEHKNNAARLEDTGDRFEIWHWDHINRHVHEPPYRQVRELKLSRSLLSAQSALSAELDLRKDLPTTPSMPSAPIPVPGCREFLSSLSSAFASGTTCLEQLPLAGNTSMLQDQATSRFVEDLEHTTTPVIGMASTLTPALHDLFHGPEHHYNAGAQSNGLSDNGAASGKQTTSHFRQFRSAPLRHSPLCTARVMTTVYEDGEYSSRPDPGPGAFPFWDQDQEPSGPPPPHMTREQRRDLDEHWRTGLFVPPIPTIDLDLEYARKNPEHAASILQAHVQPLTATSGNVNAQRPHWLNNFLSKQLKKIRLMVVHSETLSAAKLALASGTSTNPVELSEEEQAEKERVENEKERVRAEGWDF